MALIPNFDPGRSLLALQSGQNIAIDQTGAIQAQQIQLAQEGRAAALAPSQLASAQNVVEQQEASIKIVQLQQLAAQKALKSKQLSQALQRISTMSDPLKRATARKALNPLAADIFGPVLQGGDAFDDDDSDGDSELILNQILGPSTQAVTTSATGEQFRLNRLGTGFEQIPVQRIGGGIVPGGQVPAQAPTATGAVSTQVQPIVQAPSNLIVTPKVTAERRAVAAEERNVEKEIRDKKADNLKLTRDKTELAQVFIDDAFKTPAVKIFMEVRPFADSVETLIPNLKKTKKQLIQIAKDNNSKFTDLTRFSFSTGANDKALIVAATKIGDAGSAVLGSEAETTAAVGNALTTLLSQANKFFTGQQLEPTVRRDLFNSMKLVVNKMEGRARSAIRPILKDAATRGVNTQNIQNRVFGTERPEGVPKDATFIKLDNNGKEIWLINGVATRIG